MSHNTPDPSPPKEIGPVRRVVDGSLAGSVVFAVLITLIYVVSPVDAVPEIVPVAGQADDLLAVLLGGGSVSVLTVLRLLVGGIRDPATRRRMLWMVLLFSLPVLGILACVGGVGFAVLLSR